MFPNGSKDDQIDALRRASAELLEGFSQSGLFEFYRQKAAQRAAEAEKQ